MTIDLIHNKIIEQTVTDAFADGVRESLIPKLCMKYGERLVGVQMYEDYIADRFFYSGEWYYPMTVLLSDGAPLTQWVAYPYPMENAYRDLIPYAYIGDEPLTFRLCESVPHEFEEKLLNRARYADGNAIPVSVTSVGEVTVLCGKYSQSFLDEMARQLTVEIERTHHVTGLATSGIRLELAFAPGTYMEHTSEGVTYRRLLMNEGGRAMKDFWVRWERTVGDGPLTVSDHVLPRSVRFSIGEDVPQKIREREYRFLARQNADKYRNAMGRKNVTEWRELLKKAVKRGTLSRVIAPLSEVQEYMREEKIATYTKTAPKKIPVPEAVAPAAEPVLSEEDELRKKLAAIVERSGNTAPVRDELPPVADDSFEEALASARALLGISPEREEKTPVPTPAAPARASVEKAEKEDDAEALRRRIRMQVESEFEARERERLENEARRAIAEKSMREEQMEKLRREREEAERTRRELEELRAETLRLQEEIRRHTEGMRNMTEALSVEEPAEEPEQSEEFVDELEPPIADEPVEDTYEVIDAEPVAQESEEAEDAPGVAYDPVLHPTHTELEERIAKERLYTAEAVREEARRIFAEEMERLKEEQRLEEERQRAEEEERKLALAREEELRRQAEIAEKLEAERRRAEAEERARAEAIRMEEERRRLEEIRREEEERRAAAARLAEEHRRIEEMARIEDERRRAEIARLQEERARAEAIAREAYAKHLAEAERLENERRRAEEQLEAQNRRIEEAARLAEEQRRLAEETRLEHARRNAEAARAEEEQRRQLELVRREEERRREEALRMQEESRLAEEHRREEEERLRVEAQRREEEDRLREEATRLAQSRAQGEAEAPVEKVKYTYVSRTVHLMFRRSVDPNIMGRIQQLIGDTISYFNKQDVYISIRAEIVNNMQIDLIFQKIPEEERPLLINIIEVLGRSDLGIAKAQLE